MEILISSVIWQRRSGGQQDANPLPLLELNCSGREDLRSEDFSTAFHLGF